MQRASHWTGALAGLAVLIALSGCTEVLEDTLGPCAEGAHLVGEPGKFSVQRLNFDWQTKSDDLVSRTELLRFALPSDLIGVVFTLNDPGAMPWYYETLLDRKVMTAGYDGAGTPPLTRGTNAWRNAVSFAVPSNAKTELRGNARCIEIDVASIGGSFEKKGELTFTSLRRASRELGTHFDVQVRVLDDAISLPQLNAMAHKLQNIFANAGEGAPIPMLTEQWLTFESVDGTGVVIIEDEMPPDGLFYELASATMKDMERGLNIVFVSALMFDALDDDLTLLGIAGGIPGAPFDGTGASSLFISVESHLFADEVTLNVDLLASTIAHELGHTLGLFHLTEQGGEIFDPIADTEQCSVRVHDKNEDGRVSLHECTSAGGDNLMFWEADPNPSSSNRLSPEQIMVLRSHPLMYLASE